MIASCMKRQVVSVGLDTTAEEAARLVLSHHIGTLPVVDEHGVLVGVVRLQDLLQVFMPDFVALLDNIDFIPSFGAVEVLQPHDLPGARSRAMRELMQDAVSVEQTAGLLRALATLSKHQLSDLPIIDDAGVLVGIASRVDIAAEFLAHWLQASSPKWAPPQ
jgi:CBS-domain-containing membrane protein